MEPSPSPPSTLLLADSCLAFVPVPQQRHRAVGWTPDTQARFIRALEAMGSVGKAARAVGMGRASAYRLRERPGSASFAASSRRRDGVVAAPARRRGSCRRATGWMAGKARVPSTSLEHSELI